MVFIRYLAALFLSVLCLSACNTQTERTGPPSTLWRLNDLTAFANAPVTVEGDPGVVDTDRGRAVHFDGDGDRLLVHANPLGRSERLTVEVWFKPDDAWPDNRQPRFFHIEALDNPNRRVTVELRLNDRQQWYLDGFIKSERDDLTLIDETRVHPVDQWHHAALTYDGSTLRTYVNGEPELEGKVEFDPISDAAKTSIGARMNRVHWFRGSILAIRVTQEVLSTEAFLKLESLGSR